MIATSFLCSLFAGFVLVAGGPLSAQAESRSIGNASRATDSRLTGVDVQKLREAAAGGAAQAMFSLGDFFAKGEGVPQDDAEAVGWFRKAADLGHSKAMHRLGGCLAKGQGIPQDYAEAVRWYRKAAELGNATAMFNLGVSFAIGQGVPKDHAEAVVVKAVAAKTG